jgi:hypothetical protein
MGIPRRKILTAEEKRKEKILKRGRVSRQRMINRRSQPSLWLSPNGHLRMRVYLRYGAYLHTSAQNYLAEFLSRLVRKKADKILYYALHKIAKKRRVTAGDDTPIRITVGVKEVAHAFGKPELVTYIEGL